MITQLQMTGTPEKADWLSQASAMFAYMDGKETREHYNQMAQLAGLLAIAQQLARVADALEKIHADMPDVDLGRIASAVDFMAEAASPEDEDTSQFCAACGFLLVAHRPRHICPTSVRQANVNTQMNLR